MYTPCILTGKAIQISKIEPHKESFKTLFNALTK